MDELERLVTEQQTLGQNMVQLLTNAKKDSSSRKTEDYLKIRAETLEQLWGSAQVNDDAINKVGIKEHEYFEKRYFDQMKKAYGDASKYLNDCQRKIKPTEISTPSYESAQNLRLREQEIRIQHLTRLLNQIGSEAETSKPMYWYKGMRQRIEKEWEEITKMNLEIDIHEKKFEDVYFTTNKFVTTEDKYYEIMWVLEDTITAETSNKRKTIMLPQVQIPTFDGDYEKWATFKDLFLKIVHENVTLSDVEKLQYLKTHVTGEANRVIQHFQITDSNYEGAWEQLNKRYNNKRLIVSKLINRIVKFPSINRESAETLKELYTTVSECIQALRNVGVETQHWGPILISIVTDKWDFETNKQYEMSIKNSFEVQEFDDLMEYLKNRFQALESVTGSYKKIKNNCRYCDEPHSIYTCHKFSTLTVEERLEFVKKKQLCGNCINHDVNKQCYSTARCRICKKPHSTLLHKEAKEKLISKTNVGIHNQSVLLATAIIKIDTGYGYPEFLRALIDPGSQVSLITEEAATRLSLPRERIQAEINGLGSGQPKIAKHKISANYSPHFQSKFKMQTEMLILPKLTGQLPEEEKDVKLDQWKNQRLADPHFNKPKPIDVILGAQEYSNIITEGLQKTSQGLMAQNTELGWIMLGSIKDDIKNIKVVSMISRYQEDQQIIKFWELENITEEQKLTEEEKACEEKFNETTKRNQDGSYTVHIPFNEKKTRLGKSRTKAVARFIQLENKLKKNEELNMGYKRFMQEYLDMGHMEQVTHDELHMGKYYIPHQAVIKEESTTTKLRVVFDASSKTSNGISLNETMYNGPRLQQELADILLRWRGHKVAMTADIEKMYRQIKLCAEDQEYHRIIWRFNPTETIKEYKLRTVTYGTTAAPYLAVKTLQQLARDEEKKYPTASAVVMQDFYVDDLLSGADSEREAIELQGELLKLMRKGGFTLRKWSSNRKSVLETLPMELRDQTVMEINHDNIKKSLGIFWAPYDDTIRFKITLAETTTWTKRSIMADIAKIFDPIGWLAPVVLKAKLFVQELWVQQLQWDEVIPATVGCRWEQFRQELHYIEQIIVPRWTQQTREAQVELHGFCDASEKAYGAVVYVKVKDTSGSKIVLLTAKSKVAPIKTKTTLPKLELCAAGLLARLMKRVCAVTTIANPKIFLWTDSMITLSWITGSPSKWKEFVANRVSEIQNLSDLETWNHVRTEENPADIISRGTDPSKLLHLGKWWQGPNWLQGEEYPLRKGQPIPTTDEEQKKMKIQVFSIQQSSDIWKRFSSLTRMTRVIAYCIRFVKQCKKQRLETVALNVKEIHSALEHIIREVQKEAFHHEILALKNNKLLERNSKILNLHPFLDKDKILRVGGRLENSLLQYEEKHPIILPYHSHVTKLIVRDAHEKTLHGGNQITLAFIRRRFWVINGKKAVKNDISKCVKCVRFKAQASQQLMGQLPASRVTPSPPFSHVGVDYAGPVMVRTTKGRGHKSYKGYVAVFVCLATKAVHLEIVSDMTASSFLAAFKRFTARRGSCNHIYSDNGTTFVGTHNAIEAEIIRMTQDKSLQDELTTQGIQWHFIPPATPHFGGIWEAGVKSMKHHLKRITGTTTMTYEELSTLSSQIEACLNSRPIWALSEDINDMMALTPGHFLIGRELLTPMSPICTEYERNLSERWRLVQKMKKDFWHVWSTEYLQSLQQRYKWKTEQKNPKQGDVVLIKEQNINPSKWPLARIIEANPASDGNVRVVTLQKAEGSTTKKSIHNLIPLPVKEEENRETTSQARSYSQPKSKFIQHLILLVLMWICAATGTPNELYHLTYPNPGMYIEHLGQAKIDRGTFRIEIRFNKTGHHHEAQRIRQIIKDMRSLCTAAKELSRNTECDSLIIHLQEKNDQLEWLKKGLDKVISKRQKRGLLGNLLTSVFGVNDEIYHDIEALQANQQELIRASSHQTKFMLQALSTFNETDRRITDKLNRFTKKLNQGLEAISEMQRWYKTVDDNKLGIHLLSTYQVAINYIDEIMERYKKLLEVHYNQAQIYEFVTPAHIETLLETASKRLPSNIEIIPFPILRTEVQHSEQFIHLYSYFTMAEVNEFIIIKVTPVPFKVEEHKYWTISIPAEMLAVDYDSQLYFQLNEEELKSSVVINEHLYVCFPSAIHNIREDKHCIIDEIYQRTENTTCQLQQREIKNTIWKQLYTTNTWMFINPQPFRIAVTCNGMRKDVLLNTTGIITISQACIINTRENVLTPKRIHGIPVVASFIRPVEIGPLKDTISKKYEIPPEEVVVPPSSKLDELRREEKGLERELTEDTWKSIKHHNILTHVITVSIMLGLGITMMAAWKWYKHQSRIPITEDRRNTTIVLEPLVSTTNLTNQSEAERNDTEESEQNDPIYAPCRQNV